jgi:hypothetical protein
VSVQAGELAREMERVNRALETAGIHLAALDRADRARQLGEKDAYSPLLTLVEQAKVSAARVTEYLREQSRT